VWEALVSAARPRSWRERLGRGFTAREVWQRLPEALREELKGEPGPEVVRERRAIEQVYRGLLELCTQGRVRRRTASFWIEPRSKGHRGAVVDLFRS
jgi:hypothetical protein